jgi:hypothetical protein
MHFKVYIAGPMRGFPRYNAPAFRYAAKELRELGWEIRSPVEMDKEVGIDVSVLPEDTDWSNFPPDFDSASCYKRCFGALEWCDAVYCLRGWEKSLGAQAEIHMAQWMGKTLLYQDGAMRLNEKGQSPVQSEADLPQTSTSESGERRVTDPTTGAQKGTKLARFDLLPAGPLFEVAEHYGRGSRKYTKKHYLPVTDIQQLERYCSCQYKDASPLVTPIDGTHPTGCVSSVIAVNTQKQKGLPVIPTESHIAKGCADRVMIAGCENTTQSMQNGRKKIHADGLPVIQSTNESTTQSIVNELDRTSTPCETEGPCCHDSPLPQKTRCSCSTRKKESVQSVESRKIPSSAGSISTMITSQEKLEGCSVGAATKRSDCFKIIQSFLQQHSTTCALRRLSTLTCLPDGETLEVTISGDRNWEQGYSWSLSFAALQRHAWQFWSGEDIDQETGSHHLAAVAFHALALLEYKRTHPEKDDRPKNKP